MSNSHAANSPEVFDETDPHGQHFHGQHESHVIVGPFLLRSILGFLLLFTVLTVGFAQAEIAIQNWLGIELPWWVNVAGAMSIAVVKSLLVMAIFMQLRYDNPVNSVAMLFCFFALGLFLLFTGLDLFSRGWIYEFKAGQVVAGGTGQGVSTANGKPMVVAAKEKFLGQLANHEIRDSLIVADAVRAAAHAAEEQGASGLAAAKALYAFADHMTDLHTIMVHPPGAGEQARVTAELAALAERTRSSGNGPAAEIIAAASASVKNLNMAEAQASYSVDAQFAQLAAQAHGGHHEDARIGSSASMSRAQSGLSGALSEKGGHAAKSHGGH